MTESKTTTSPNAMEAVFGVMPRSRIALETGMHSPWVGRLLSGHILGPFGPDCDLRRWGLKLAQRGGRNPKKRAIIATSRKLAVLLHHLWVSGEVYEPLHNNQQHAIAAAA